MKRKPYPVSQITGGLATNLDPMMISDVQSPNLSMVRFYKGLVTRQTGLAAFAGLTSERVMHFDLYKQYDGDIFTVCAGVDHAYKYATGTWSKISTTGPVFTGGADDIFYSTTFDDLWIVTNGKDVLQKWDGTTWANLGGSPPICKYLLPFYSRLVTAHTTESGTIYPSRIRWSIIGDGETWTGTGSGAIDLLDSKDKITGLAILGDRMFIFKEESIWELYYIGGTDVFKVRLITNSVGCLSGKTIITARQKLWFFSYDNIYSFDGNSCEPVSSQIFDYLYETGTKVVNTAKMHRAFGVHDYSTGIYTLVLPTVDNAEPNLILYYSLNDKSFSRRTKLATCVGYYIDSSGIVPWSTATTHWNSGGWAISWRSGSLASGMPTLLYGAADGTVVHDNKITKSTEELVWESKDFIFGHLQRFVACRYLVKGDPFYVKYSVDNGSSWTTPKLLTPSLTQFTEVADTDLNFTSLTLRVNITTSNDDFELKWVEPWYIPRVEPAFA